MPEPVKKAFAGEPSSPYVAYLQDSQQPLNALIFLLPILAVYHFGIWFLRDLRVANGAAVMLAEGVNLLYFAGLAGLRALSPELAAEDGVAAWFLRTFSSLFALFFVAFTLLLWQNVSARGRWRFKPKVFFFMFLESVLFALPLLALDWVVRYIAEYPAVALSAVPGGAPQDWLAGLVLSAGAGVYEEFLFRLLLMGGMFWAGRHLLGLSELPRYWLAMLGQALAFAAFHYLPWSPEEFLLPVFTFRLAAGLYFGYLFQERGLGITAAGHAVYDILAVMV